MTRQQYTPEFKRRAVTLLLESRKSVTRMAPETLYQREYTPQQEKTISG